MPSDELDRSDFQMNRELFAAIFKLGVEHSWLRDKANELHELLVMCTGEGEKELITDLLARFHYTSASDHLAKVATLAKQIAEIWQCDPKNTHIVALENGELSDSSNRASYDLKAPLAYYEGWSNRKFVSRLGDVVDAAKAGGTVVVVDDFVGSGGSIEKKVNWLRPRLEAASKNVEIKVGVVSAMMQSRERVEAVCKEYYAVEWLSRGISDHYSGAELENSKAYMERIESELAPRDGNFHLDKFRFGWEKSEALFFTEGANPPNNNFPVFWWRHLKPKKKRKPILRRI